MDEEKRQALLRKIKKCLALSKSDREHEAAAALRQAKKLMDLYGFDQNDIELADVIDASIKSGALKSPPAWEVNLVTVIADIFSCKAIFSRTLHNVHLRYGTVSKRTKYAEWQFYGLGCNAELAVYTYQVLYRKLKGERQSYITEHLGRLRIAKKRTYLADTFAMIWVQEVRSKIVDLVPDARTMDLLDQYITKYKSVSEGDARFNESHGAGISDDRIRHAMLSGMKAGREVDLNKPVNTDKREGLGQIPQISLLD